jgi:SAM-dependent methyltransferase
MQAQKRDYHASSTREYDKVDSCIDEFVQENISATNGIMYKSLINNLTEYPIPDLRLPPGRCQWFLDIGCNWGRWCIAADRKGYRPVGIDPSLEAIKAAMRVARQLDVEAHFLVGDARYLPFEEGFFDYAFSYSVLQHFAKEDAKRSLEEIRRVLKVGKQSLIQMPNAWGVRSLYQQIKRGFRKPVRFEVRYWTPKELRGCFERLIGPSVLSVDGFLSLNAQHAEAHLLPKKYRMVVELSEKLRRCSEKMRWFNLLADSLYISSTKG